ncbi:hypothetical protein DL766_007543 [Monosporascus sp. MC13-8B]|uniref:Uncharacterized protein n=1 Tax=Monosporascus cannonballus TaxID=155416 RepID=A0ABY0H8V8_9PEZI|nr:hypothetical protein DL762_005127 [Monosporascus cannonballus]RYO91508.1 hypothetical protein DL763_004972 [Monosporascus cannonballus]RYP23224.1 hypothetical protein DL766_007543 [Monosporascus sp. MC13-8B]
MSTGRDVEMGTLGQLPEKTAASVNKLPPIPRGSKVVKRRISERAPSTHSAHRIYINTKSPFWSVTARVRKQLDKNLRQASYANKAFTNKLAGRKNASLDERVRAIRRYQQGGSASASGIGLEDAGEVLVLATGRAIEKAVNVASFFRKQGDCVVQLRTTSVGAVDDIIAEGDEEFPAGDETRKRMVSCLEVSIKLR